MPKRRIQPADFKAIYDIFNAPVSRFDCGKYCSPLNGGEPVCCSTENAVPIVDRAEFELLQSRSDLWHRHRPNDTAGKELVKDLHSSCLAVECKGARLCERDNRSLACRSFPFFPYLDRKDNFIGLSIHWTFADRCWVMSNLEIVDAEYRRQFVAAHELLFEKDPEEFQVHREYSASLRRVFSRKRLAIPLIGRDGGLFKILPYGGAMVAATPKSLPKFGPYRSERAYRTAVDQAAHWAAIEAATA
jgi:Fe-S-cluster containining protein